jgi:putative ABC transport system substrate-binding protein
MSASRWISYQMRRRELIVDMTIAAILWPCAVRAQQKALPVIGFLSSHSPEDSSAQVAAFRRGLAELGYVEGENLAIEYRWARGDYKRLPTLAADLVGKAVRVVATVGGEPSALAAKAATSMIPIVFAMGSDPVQAGLVESYNRPGGNITGIDVVTDTMGNRSKSPGGQVCGSGALTSCGRSGTELGSVRPSLAPR